MRKIVVLVAMLAATTNALAVDYRDARITGVGLAHADGVLRFTIDKDPNVIFITDNYTGEQLKRVIALILSAYHAQSPVEFVRSEESVSSSVRHYSSLVDVSLGTYTWD